MFRLEFGEIIHIFVNYDPQVVGLLMGSDFTLGEDFRHGDGVAKKIGNLIVVAIDLVCDDLDAYQ